MPSRTGRPYKRRSLQKWTSCAYWLVDHTCTALTLSLASITTQISRLIRKSCTMSALSSTSWAETSSTLLSIHFPDLELTYMFRNHIVERYLQLQLAEYRRIFRSTDEVGHEHCNIRIDCTDGVILQAGQLDNVPRRYAWFRRILKHHDEEDLSLFPASWQVTRMLVASFSEYTRADLSNVLGKNSPNIAVLLDALQNTLDFELSFAKRFEMPVSGCS